MSEIKINNEFDDDYQIKVKPKSRKFSCAMCGESTKSIFNEIGTSKNNYCKKCILSPNCWLSVLDKLEKKSQICDKVHTKNTFETGRCQICGHTAIMYNVFGNSLCFSCREKIIITNECNSDEIITDI